jgi:chromosome segregation ATPase
MAKGEKDATELVRAAQTLEDELGTLEALSKAVQKTRLDSEKNIARAAKELGAALELPERLAAGLLALGAELQHMQARQQAALEPLAARANEIRERGIRLDVHVRAFAELGRATAEATETLQADRPAAAMLDELKAGLAKIADDAKVLFEAARADDFPDVAREADALAKRVTHLRRRLETTSN